MDRFGPTNLPILLVAATGTGKELFAEHIHWRSGRPGHLVPVNCAALPRDTAESLLFGHRRGAFTNAIESRPGYFRLAHGRTLFLDEVLSLPFECQAKLLRAVESGEVWPLGESQCVEVDVRVVAAAHDDLAPALRHGALRLDLYMRLSGIVLELPPLARRREDVLPLARHFAGLQGQPLERAAEETLLSYGWPGNVRELRRVIERAGPLANGTLTAVAVAQAIAMGVPAPTAPTGRSSAESRFVADVIRAAEEVGWHAARIAARLRVDRATLFRRLARLGVSSRELRKSHESRDGRATGATPAP
jgi:transcriptional regulator with GAF, ATPase, and Fis domain